MRDGGSDHMDAALRALGEVLRAEDGPPSDLVASAKALYTWRTVDAELAALTFDSIASADLAGVRSGDAARSVTFETAAVVIDVEISPAGARFDLVGSLAPADARSLTLQHVDGGTTEVSVDGLGRFRVAGVAPGTVRFVVEASDTARVVTDWVGL